MSCLLLRQALRGCAVMVTRRAESRVRSQVEVRFLSGHASMVNPFGFSSGFSDCASRAPISTPRKAVNKLSRPPRELSRSDRDGRARQIDSSSSAVPSPVAALIAASVIPRRLNGTCGELRLALAHVGQVDLVEHDKLRARGQLRIVERELRVHRLVVAQRRAARRRRRVQQVDQQAGSVEVAEEAVAQPGARVRAFDQARDVGDDERALARQRARSPGSAPAS